MCFARQKFRLGRQAGKESTENSKDGIYSVDLFVVVVVYISVFEAVWFYSLFIWLFGIIFVRSFVELYHVRGTIYI
jgi:hypothetical protein